MQWIFVRKHTIQTSLVVDICRVTKMKKESRDFAPFIWRKRGEALFDLFNTHRLLIFA